MKNKIKDALKIIPNNIKLDEKDIEITLLELKRRVGAPKLLFSKRSKAQ